MRGPVPDWYGILGVAPTATRAEIGAAFRAAMKTCHPDLFPGDAEKGARARALSSAKSVLGDEERRAAYDTARARPAPTPDEARAAGARTKAKPSPKARAPKARAPKAAPKKKTKAAKTSPRPPKPTSRSRLAVEYLGLRRYAGRSWKQTVSRMHREAMKALNPGKRLPTMRIVVCTVRAPGVIELRFACTRARQKVVMGPYVARLYWAA